MGKLKKSRKNKKARVNPLQRSDGSNDVNGSANPERDENLRQSKILPLIAKLASTVPNDKSMALAAITVLCDDAHLRTLFLKDRIISILMESCLNDSSDEIVVEAYGVLRNLAIEQGPEVIKFLWRSDIWTPLQAALEKIKASFAYLLQNGPGKDKSKSSLLYDFAENILSLILILCTELDHDYDILKPKISPALDLICDLLNHQSSPSPHFKVSSSLYNALLEFVHDLSCQFPEFASALSQNNTFSLSLCRSYVYGLTLQTPVLPRIYVESITFNIETSVPLPLSKKEPLCKQILDNVVSQLLTIDLNQLVSDLSALKLPDNAQLPIHKPLGPVNTLEAALSQDASHTRKVQLTLTALEISLDLIASVLEYLAHEDDEVSSAGESETSNGLLSDTIDETLVGRVGAILCELLQFELSNQQALSLTTKTLIALNNLTWLVNLSPVMPASWFERSGMIWDGALTALAHNDVLLQKNCLSTMWAIAKAWGPETSNKVNEELINKLVSLAHEARSAVDSAANLDEDSLDWYVALVGFLGTVAPVANSSPITSAIGQFLLELVFWTTLTPSADPAVAEVFVEGLNMIYDTFSDKAFPYDLNVFVQQKYLEKLVEMEPQVRHAYKLIDRNKLPLAKDRAQEAFLNLGRFIQYKRKEQ